MVIGTNTVPFRLIRQSRVTVPCGPALILVHVTHHFDFGRMRKMVQKKSFKIKISCIKTVYKASDTTIIINYAVKYSIFVGIPVVIMAPKSGVTMVLSAFSHVQVPYQRYHSHNQPCSQTSLPHSLQQEHPCR